MTTIQRPIKGKTIITRIKNDESLTLEQLAVEYGWETEKFFELLKKSIGSVKFAEIQKKDAKRQKKVSGDNMMREEENMKARISNTIETTATPKTSMNFKEELKLRTTLGDMSKAENASEITSKEENIMENNVTENKAQETQEITLEELQDKKVVVETQIRAKSGEKASKELLLQIAQQERDETSEQVEALKEKLAVAEGELLDKEITLENLERDITEIQAKAAQYQKELEEIEAQISKLTTIYLIVPYTKRRPIKDATNISSQPKIKTDGTIDSRIKVEKVETVDDFGISAFEAKNLGYKDLERFCEDCAFVCLVRSYKEAGKHYEVLTAKDLPINSLMDKVFGEGEW